MFLKINSIGNLLKNQLNSLITVCCLILLNDGDNIIYLKHTKFKRYIIYIFIMIPVYFWKKLFNYLLRMI